MSDDLLQNSGEPTVKSVARCSDDECYFHYQEGDFCRQIGRKIQELVMKTEDYIVFLDEFGGVQWSHKESVVPKESAKHYDSVCNRVADMEARSLFLREKDILPERITPPDGDSCKLPAKTLSDDEEKNSYPNQNRRLFIARRLIAEGIARLLDGAGPESTKEILDTAEKWINQRSIDYSRNWFLVRFMWSAVIVFGIALALIIALSFSTSVGGRPFDLNHPLLLLIGTLLGGSGAFISAALFNKKIPLDATAGKRLHNLEADIRLAIGMAGGVIVVLLIRSGIFLGFLKEPGNTSLSACLLFSFLAGASELFLPTLLNRFDDSLKIKATPPE